MATAQEVATRPEEKFEFELDEDAWAFALAFGGRYADDCSVDNRRVGEKDGFDLHVDHSPATDFDEVLGPSVRGSRLLALGGRAQASVGWTGWTEWTQASGGGWLTFARLTIYTFQYPRCMQCLRSSKSPCSSKMSAVTEELSR